MDTLARIGQLNNTATTRTPTTLMTVLKTTVEMLQDREETNIQACQSPEEVLDKMANAQHVIRSAGCRVFFHNEDRVGIKQLRAWVECVDSDRLIVVSLEGPTTFTRREAEHNYPHVQFFLFRDLCVNITKHVLVPRHEKVSKSDIPISVSDDMREMPVLFTTDRVVQYYNFQEGDTIRITRTAGAQEPVYYYRVVRCPRA